jgi:hypothetical protein
MEIIVTMNHHRKQANYNYRSWYAPLRLLLYFLLSRPIFIFLFFYFDLILQIALKILSETEDEFSKQLKNKQNQTLFGTGAVILRGAFTAFVLYQFYPKLNPFEYRFWDAFFDEALTFFLYDAIYVTVTKVPFYPIKIIFPSFNE